MVPAGVLFPGAASLLAPGNRIFTSAVNVFFKDMAQIVSICLQFGIWMTPIMYHESHVYRSRKMGGSAVQAESLFIMWWPGSGYHAHRKLVLGTAHTDPLLLGLYRRWCLLGLKMFKRLRPHFSDVL